MLTQQEVFLSQIKNYIHQLRNRTPKVGIFGNSGVGKSSLCNALFGQDICRVNDIEACTREPQEVNINSDDNTHGIQLFDMPGIGEDIEHQEEYTKLYVKTTPTLDVILWVIKADDRAYASMLKTYLSIKEIENVPPMLFVVNQVDKLSPIDAWDKDKNQPGDLQEKNITLKANDISERFKISQDKIIFISAEKKYNLAELISSIIKVVPNEKKYSFARETNEDIKTQEHAVEGEKGLINAVKDFCGKMYDIFSPMIVDIVKQSAPVIIKKCWDVLKRFF